MSLVAEAPRGGNRRDIAGINDVLAGNLCRCTGYGTIIDAAQNAADDTAPDLINEREEETLRLLETLTHDEMLSLNFGARRYYAPNH